MKRIVTCTGFHGTGSSIISDLLKEYKNIKSFGEFEFRFLQDPHGVGSLEDVIINNNCRLNSDRGIYDFLRFIKKLSRKRIPFVKKNEYEKIFKNNFEKISKEYIEELVDLRWNGWWHDFIFRDRDIFETIIYKLKRSIFLIYKGINLICGKKIEGGGIKEDFYCSYKSREEFIEITKKYLNKLFNKMEVTEDILCLDQLVPVISMDKYLKYFENIKVIIIDRDPRDLYVINKFIYKDGVVPTENVDIFIQHFLLLRKEGYKNFRENVMRINFEECIYNYEESLKKISNFLELDEEKHDKKKRYFNPEISKNNTQLYFQYPEIENDILKIEKSLNEYCYKYPYKIDSNKKEIF